MTASLVPLALAVDDLSGVALIAALLGVGTGLGLATVPLQMAAIEAVDASKAGFVSGMFSTGPSLGSIAGISLLTGPLAPASSGFGAFRVLFAVVAGSAAVSAAIALLLAPRPRAEHTVDHAEAA